jgi:hypothetical protein
VPSIKNAVLGKPLSQSGKALQLPWNKNPYNWKSQAKAYSMAWWVVVKKLEKPVGC